MTMFIIISLTDDIYVLGSISVLTWQLAGGYVVKFKLSFHNTTPHLHTQYKNLNCSPFETVWSTFSQNFTMIHQPACSSGTLTNVLPQEFHAAGTGHDTPSRHSIQTQGRHVIVLSTDVERHTGIHNYPF